MSGHLFARCKQITHELLERPLNLEFSKPADPEKGELHGYLDVIRRPMDLGTIEATLNQDGYATPLEWYNDVCLVYDNAMKFHPQGSFWWAIAHYNMMEFKRMAIGFGCSDPQQWYDWVSQTMFKLNKYISNGPVPQAIDPLILSVKKKAESMLPPTPQSIADLVDKINRRMEEDDIRYDVLCLLNQTQPNLKIDGPEFTIDADTLTDVTLNALSLYVKAHL
jgi:hypothetical protein